MNERLRAWLIPGAMVFLFLHGLAQAAAPQVTARLDVLSTPTLGGTGQVIWAAIPNVTAPAELSFILQRPGAPEKVTTAPLNLIQGKIAECIYLLDTPQPGQYQISAIVAFAHEGRTWRQVAPPITIMPAPGSKQLNKPLSILIPLTANGPLIIGEITQASEQKQFLFTQAVGVRYAVEAIRGSMPNLKLVVKNGLRMSWVSCSGNDSAAHIVMSILTSGTSQKEIWVSAADTLATGTFFIHVTTGPMLNGILINQGATETYWNLVSITPRLPVAYLVYPQEYLASESADFTNATWKPFPSSNIPFVLSSGTGKKTIYFKVRQGGLESVVYSATINLLPSKPLTPNASAINGSLAGSSNAWYQFSITQAGYYLIEKTTVPALSSSMQLYRNSNGVLVGAAYSQMTKWLEPGDYSLKIYTDKTACTYTIRLIFTGAVSSFSINQGAAETSNRIVTLNNTYVGSPTHYMASVTSDFAGETWQPYSTSPKYKLNAGNVSRRVYFKIKNANGTESQVVSDTITLRETLPISANGSWRNGTINPAGDADWFELNITSEDSYTIETRCGTLEDTVMALYGPNSKTSLVKEDDDSGDNYAAKITKQLKRGVYYIKVCAKFPQETGAYSISVKKN